jgi:cell division protein FtsI (penicillin-binding protein 3)
VTTRLRRIVRVVSRLAAAFDPLRGDDRPEPAFESAWRPHVKGRVLVVVGIMVLWAAAIQARLVDLQVLRHTELSTEAHKYQQREIPLDAPRGDIVDRHGELLAYSVEADAISADPSQIKNPTAAAAAVCKALGDCTPAERAQLATRLSEKESQYTVIRRSRAVSPAQVKNVEALKIPGIVLEAGTRRYYPRYDLAAHVLGFVDVNNVGQAGVERKFENAVRGVDGVAYAQVDAKGQRLDMRVERAPAAGGRLELTIDMYLQYIVERELAAGVEANKAKGGAAVVMDPHTGEILALASYPTFNPNAVGSFTDDDRRNRATQDVYEPGSTF